MKFTFIVFILLLSINNYGQQTVSKSEVIDAKIELYENKIDSKLRELDLKEDNLELSKQNVADIINFHKEGMEEFHRTLNYLLVVMGIIVSVVIAAAGYYLERFNKRKTLELKKDIEDAWKESRDWFFTHTAITGAEYYQYNVELAKKYGWAFGGDIAGHLIGNFPHEKIESESRDNYIHPDNQKDMFAPGVLGTKREWILEIHFVDIDKQIGGFVSVIKI